MKRTLTTAVVIGLAAGVSAQTVKIRPIANPSKAIAAPYLKQTYNGEEILSNLIAAPNPYVVPGGGNKIMEGIGIDPYTVGISTYDLQTNASVQNRIRYYNTDKTVTTVWTMSKSTANTYPDRGTGYNFNDGSTWINGNDATARLEGVRVGWPSVDYSETQNKKEFVITHNGAVPTLHMIGQAVKGSENWTGDGDITPTALWPRAKAGGPDGSTIHLISVSDNDTAASVPSPGGMKPALQYSRSLNGGATWDKLNVIPDGVDTSITFGTGGDSYAIDVKGSVVAIAVFNSWDPSFILKSTDNGNTWTRTFFLTTGLQAYKVEGNISDTNSDGVADTVTSTDNSGAVLIDNNDNVHVVFGLMRYLDTDISDTGRFTSFFPGTSGLAYWNQGFTGGPTVIQDVVDENGNDTLDITLGTNLDGAGDYGLSLTSMPQLGQDANGIIYLSWSAVSETRLGSANNNQHFHRMYVSSSLDNGATWDGAFEIYANGDEQFGEYVFPSLAKNVDDRIRILVQRDYEPGLAVRGDLDAIANNDMLYFEFPADYRTTSVSSPALNTSDLSVFPNPASDYITISFNNLVQGDVNMYITDLTGKRVKTISKDITTGMYNTNLTVSDLASGMYMLNVQNGKSVQTTKFIVK